MSQNIQLFLHIGMNKTGSTSLQYWLNSHYDQLLQQRILYPRAIMEGDAHYTLTDAFRVDGKFSNEQIKALTRIRKLLQLEMQGLGIQKLILSSEGLICVREPRHIKAYFSQLGFQDIKVVVHLRRHDHWWRSMFNQYCKTTCDLEAGVYKGLEAYLSRVRDTIHFANYKNMLANWAHVFGKENIIVRCVEKPQLPNGLAIDFLEALDIDPSGFSSEMKSLNESMSNQAVRILEVAQRSQLSQKQFNKIKAYLAEHDTFESFDHTLSPSRRRDMINYCQESQYNHIAKEYLGRQDGILFYEDLPSDDATWKAFRPVPEEQTVSTILKALLDG